MRFSICIISPRSIYVKKIFASNAIFIAYSRKK
nr:MAG TPA: hypothetical protein [Caudoviricetes sp.]